MSYVTLYRKYRPGVFDDVFGQTHVTQTLQNAIKAGRLGHAFLFCGPRGCGKTTTARLLAKALNCEKGPTDKPCGECEMCKSIANLSAVDVVEMDAASETGIENVKETIIENAKYPPMEARFKVYIVDEAHDLSPKAFDALLKTLEEPPAHVIFVLATTEYQKVPATIRSRCQLYMFHRGTISDLMDRLKFVVDTEGFKAEPEALAAIARMSDGSWRDSLTLLEQVIAFGVEPITLKVVDEALGLVEEDTLNAILDSLLKGDAAGVLTGIDKQMLAGREPRTIVDSLTSRIRELIFTAYEVPMGDWVDSKRSASVHEQATRIGKAKLHNWWSKLAETGGQLRNSGAPRLYLELCLLDIASEANKPAVVVAPTVIAVPPKPVEETAPKKPAFPKPVMLKDEPQVKIAPEESIKMAVKEPAPSVVETQKSATVTAGKTGYSVDALQNYWDQMVSNIRAKSPGGAQVLTGAKVLEVNGKLVKIGFGSEMAVERVSEIKRKKFVEEHFSLVIGDNGWRIEPIYNSAYAPPPPPVSSLVPDSVEPALEGEALANEAIEILDGDEISGN